jgi:hypothetical protein
MEDQEGGEAQGVATPLQKTPEKTGEMLSVMNFTSLAARVERRYIFKPKIPILVYF